ncbi:glutathione peroxidase [Carboxylicivirga sp. N1Y90]|uniref:glutathione peroxidase n=1 Tax=Carboxylicivirga fragile TaxID=3417571 RepID=UPI003D329653|nr:glutathione peroxidase [Marinilabiliaceae bacterium N1Y90]
MKIAQTLSLLLFISVSLIAQTPASIYEYEAKTIDGEAFDFKSLKGKKVMIVNVASKCGLTPQYEQLQQLHEEYGGDDFVIIGFPANNFMSQEPGSELEIKEFCTENYQVTFQLMSKISVKGDDIHPIYQWLTQENLNKLEDNKVKWNFQKYLIDEKGNLVKVVSPRTKPYDDEIITWLKG